MQLKDEAFWKSCVKKNKDMYGSGVIRYAERWADLMESHIGDEDPEKAIISNAKRDSHTADSEGITGFMYGCAVSILSRAWIHGEALRKWHNLDTQIGDEGERANESGSVLNPALLVVGK